MRNILLVLVVGATACAARAVEVPTIPVQAHYSCDNTGIERLGNTIQLASGRSSKLGWQDSDGDHFVAWPAPTDVETTEYLFPTDRKADAFQRTYDTSQGTSRADWRLVKSDVCKAKGGYSDVLARFLSGESIDDLSRDLSVNREEARTLVHDALITAQRRYFRDR